MTDSVLHPPQSKKTSLSWARPIGDDLETQRQWVWKSGLANLGDTIMVWVNEGDFWNLLLLGDVEMKEFKNPEPLPSPKASSPAESAWRPLIQQLAWYYSVNDCGDRANDDALEVPIRDLRAAYELAMAAGIPIQPTTVSVSGDSSPQNFAESDPAVTPDFPETDTGNNATPWANSPRDIQKRALKASTAFHSQPANQSVYDAMIECAELIRQEAARRRKLPPQERGSM